MSFLQMSLSGGLLILAIVLLRALALYKLPKGCFVLLWQLALLRLLCPFSLPSALNIFSLGRRFAAAAPQALPTPLPAPLPLPLPIQATLEEPLSAAGPSTLEVLWFLGAAGLGLFFLAAYVRCCRDFATALPLENEAVRAWLADCPCRRKIAVRQLDRISTPLTYGLLRPVILLPKGLEGAQPQQLRCILAHESVHILRWDALWKLLATAALCLHWFNPLVWLLYSLFSRDLELACDQEVLRRFGGGSAAKAAYARLLLDLEAQRSGLEPFCNNFSKTAIEERIVVLMKSKKGTLLSFGLGGTLVLALALLFVTSPKPVEPQPEKQPVLSTQLLVLGSPEEEADDSQPPEEEKKALEEEVEWWTAEEYRQWLEKEKVALQQAIGSKASTKSRGSFTWTQELVDETIAQYEETLKQIEQGLKISKPNADGVVLYSSGDWGVIYSREEQENSVLVPDGDSASPAASEGWTTYYSRDHQQQSSDALVPDGDSTQQAASEDWTAIYYRETQKPSSPSLVEDGQTGLEELSKSFVYKDGWLSFTFPESCKGCKLWVSGRQVVEGFGGMSYHPLSVECESQNWQPGAVYSMDLAGGRFSELTLTLALSEGDRASVVDLLPLLPEELRAEA